jgi:hypothetical protein
VHASTTSRRPIGLLDVMTTVISRAHVSRYQDSYAGSVYCVFRLQQAQSHNESLMFEYVRLTDLVRALSPRNNAYPLANGHTVCARSLAEDEGRPNTCAADRLDPRRARRPAFYGLGLDSSSARLWSMSMISMRRFFCRPSGVSFGAIGAYSPRPDATMCSGGTPTSCR